MYSMKKIVISIMLIILCLGIIVLLNIGKIGDLSKTLKMKSVCYKISFALYHKPETMHLLCQVAVADFVYNEDHIPMDKRINYLKEIIDNPAYFENVPSNKSYIMQFKNYYILNFIQMLYTYNFELCEDEFENYKDELGFEKYFITGMYYVHGISSTKDSIKWLISVIYDYPKDSRLLEIYYNNTRASYDSIRRGEIMGATNYAGE